ncbi:Ig-like domain-containing protein, partial [Pseudomonas syringae]|nr:Ig-like domain-containing protein [Pseudomonas syringae]
GQHQPDGGQPHPDASQSQPEGGSPPPDAGQPQPEGGIAPPDAMPVWNPSLQITSPGALSYTNGVVMVAVTATGFPSPPTVTLYVDDSALPTPLDPISDYRLTWDTARVTEGPRTLRATARYDNRDVVSASVT